MLVKQQNKSETNTNHAKCRNHSFMEELDILKRYVFLGTDKNIK